MKGLACSLTLDHAGSYTCNYKILSIRIFDEYSYDVMEGIQMTVPLCTVIDERD